MSSTAGRGLFQFFWSVRSFLWWDGIRKTEKSAAFLQLPRVGWFKWKSILKIGNYIPHKISCLILSRSTNQSSLSQRWQKYIFRPPSLFLFACVAQRYHNTSVISRKLLVTTNSVRWTSWSAIFCLALVLSAKHIESCGRRNAGKAYGGSEKRNISI